MTAKSAAFKSNSKDTLLGVWSVLGGSNLNVLGNYFKYFCLNVVAFEVLPNTMGILDELLNYFPLSLKKIY